MNTDFAGPQLHGVIEREQPQAIIYDAEFDGLLEGADEARADPRSSPGPTRARSRRSRREHAIAAADDAARPAAGQAAFVVLTSGTTGTPKGAQRASPDGLLAARRPARKIPCAAARRR